MSEENTEQLMSEGQKAKLLRDIHHALVGDPFDPARPGLVALVSKHDETLYGKDGRNGLRSEAFKVRKLIWMGGGFICALQAFLFVYEVWKTAVH